MSTNSKKRRYNQEDEDEAISFNENKFKRIHLDKLFEGLKIKNDNNSSVNDSPKISINYPIDGINNDKNINNCK